MTQGDKGSDDVSLVGDETAGGGTIGRWLARELGGAERRQIVVLFCDIADSTKLTLHYDPEAISGLLAAYRRGVSSIVTALGGSVVRYVGDGVLAIWGYPRCTPEDCRKAVAAALDIVASRPEAIGVRVAIDAGIVVVGDIGASANGEAEIVGPAPNRASRLQARAPVNGVAITDAVRGLIGATYDLAPLSGCDEIGAAGDSAWLVRERRTLACRRQAMPLREIVSRDSEKALLSTLWQDDAAPRIVQISGEAGIGKSALVDWALAQAVGKGVDVITVDCLPEQRHSTLHVARQVLTAIVERLEPTGAPLVERLAAMLSAAGPFGSDDVDLIAQILEPKAFDGGAAPASAAATLARVAELTATLLEQIASARRVVLAIEDVHWCDAAGVKLLQIFVGLVGAGAGKLRVLVTRRAVGDWQPRFPDHDAHRHIALKRMTLGEITLIAEAVLQDSGRATTEAALIAERADGNPLLAVELARLKPEEQARLLTGSPATHPSTLNAVLCMRLDELGADKQLVQAAAVLGRQFDQNLLADVVGVDRYLMAKELDRLAATGVIVPAKLDGGPAWRFSHGLLRDVAYGTLLRETREKLHARAAALLIERFVDHEEQEPELVAEHATMAHLYDEAFVWWRKAAARAVAMSSTLAAIRHGERALSVRALAGGARDPREEIELLNLLAPQLAALHGNASPRVRATYQRCVDLADSLPNISPKLKFQLLWGLQTSATVGGQIGEALAASARLSVMAEQMESDGARVLAHRVSGLAELLAGRPRRASAEFAIVHARYDERRHRKLRQRFAADQGVVALAQDAWALSVAGDEAAACQRARTALTHAAEIGHPHTSAHVACILAARAQMVGDLQAARALAGGALVTGRMNRFPYWIAWASILVGWLEGQISPERGMQAIRKGIEVYVATGAELMLPYARLLLADLLLAAGRPTPACGIASEALRRSASGGLDLWTAPLLQTLAAAADRLGDHDNADRLIGEADAVIDRQGSALFRRRAGSSILGREKPNRPSVAGAVARQALSLLSAKSPRSPHHG